MKKISIARIIANQRNAQKSTGPRSPDGKQRSALNALDALDHGLAAQALLPGESEDRHQHHLHRSLRGFHELTRLRRHATPGVAVEMNQALTEEYPQKPNEPTAENAHPESGEPKAA